MLTYMQAHVYPVMQTLFDSAKIYHWISINSKISEVINDINLVEFIQPFTKLLSLNSAIYQTPISKITKSLLVSIS